MLAANWRINSGIELACGFEEEDAEEFAANDVEATDADAGIACEGTFE